MRHLEGTPRHQTQLLPPSVEEYVAEDHPVRVIDAFVDSLDLGEMGFEKARTATTGRRPYHPGDLLKLYIYAYLNQTSSTRRLEKECHRNLEVLWLMKQLTPDFKTIADFRKDNGEAIRKVCRQFILFCKEAGLVSGKLVAIDGSKFKAAASKDQALTRKQLQQQLSELEHRIAQYLERLEQSEDHNDEGDLDQGKVADALAYLHAHKAQLQDELQTLVDQGQTQTCRTESDAHLMRSGREGVVVGYNAQNAVDAKHQLIIHHELTQSASDNQQLKPITEGAREALGGALEEVVADAGYSSGKQLSQVQSSGVTVTVPANRALNTQGTGQYFQKSDFIYLPDQDVYRCPAGKYLTRKTINNKKRLHLYSRSGCNECPMQARCTGNDRRWLSRHFDEQALDTADQAATPKRMVQRMTLVEPPFAILKRMLNQGRFRCWGLASASSEYSLGVLSYNLMKAINVLGVQGMLAKLA